VPSSLRTAEAADLPGIAVSVGSGRLTAANGTFVEALGWDEGELEGHALDEIVHPDDRRAAASFPDRVRRGRVRRGRTVRTVALAEGSIVPTLWIGLASREDDPAGVAAVPCRRQDGASRVTGRR